MNQTDKPKRHAPVRWTVVSLMLALVVIGVVTVAGLHAIQAKEDDHTILSPGQPGIIQRIETILRNDEKEAQQRINETLKALEEAKQSEKAQAAPADNDPFGNWALFQSPFADKGWDPFGEMNQMRRNMERVFNDSFSRMRLGAPSSLTDEVMAWSPQGEFEETNDAYIYRFDVPGVDKSAVNVTLEGNRLTVEGQRESRIEKENKDNNFYLREIQQGQFQRVTTVPRDVDLNGNLKSKLENGVLTVTLPKLKGVKKTDAQKIEIQ
ncbi:Hsp20/alpha crystallin family protein [Candidatus Sumerlaeota bacterium]|nr:Hsp20/alpha crystallin family protein [Candidatus Sumerlaeota bacterium]